MKKLLKINLQLFAAGTNVQTTATEGLSDEMRTFYSDYLIDNAEPLLVHDQFGQKRPIPANGGKTIQFRKYDSLPKLTTTLAEGVTPTGQSLNMGIVEATVSQYGGYVEFSDILLLTAIDNNMSEATKLLGSQAGRTLDTITREVLAGGTNVQFGEEAVNARYLLKGGLTSGNHYLTVDCIRRAVRTLKNQNAEKIEGTYVAIIHPDCSYDLMSDPAWKAPHQYADPTHIYEGEIGKIEGVRFVESTEAKIFHANDLTANSRTLTVSAYTASGSGTASAGGGTATTYQLTVAEAITNDLVGRKLQYFDASAGTVVPFEVSGVDTANKLIFSKTALGVTYASGDLLYPGEAGFCGRDVYATLVLGANAYGVTEITGGGLVHIVKQLGSAGASDPLNQRATVGWKATKAAVRLVEQFMVRIETCCSYQSGAN